MEDFWADDEDELKTFTYEPPEVKLEREYRKYFDAEGHYFAEPNRAQRRHIANSWKRKPSLQDQEDV